MGGRISLCMCHKMHCYAHTKRKQQTKTIVHLRIVLLEKFNFFTACLFPLIIVELLEVRYYSTRGVFALLDFFKLPSITGYTTKSLFSMRLNPPQIPSLYYVWVTISIRRTQKTLLHSYGLPLELLLLIYLALLLLRDSFSPASNSRRERYARHLLPLCQDH